MPGVTSGHLPRCAGADAVRLAGARLPVREDARVEALAGLWMRTPGSVIVRCKAHRNILILISWMRQILQEVKF